MEVQHERSHPPVYCLCCGIALGLVASNTSFFTDHQLDALIRLANGYTERKFIANKTIWDPMMVELPALLALGISAMGSKNVYLARCIDLERKGRSDLGHFFAYLTRLLICWDDIGIINPNNPFEIAAISIYLATRHAGSQSTGIKSQLIQLMESSRHREEDPCTFAAMKIEFAQDCIALALSIVMAGSGDLDALRLLRSRHRSNLGDNFGRHSLHSLALGLLHLGCCKGNWCISSQDSTMLGRIGLLVSILPIWQSSIDDVEFYLPLLRHFWIFSLSQKQGRSLSPSLASMDLKYEEMDSDALELLRAFADSIDLIDGRRHPIGTFEPMQVERELAHRRNGRGRQNHDA
jgi:hypothetical protein